MDAKKAVEEFIRRESKPNIADAETELETEQETIETDVSPEIRVTELEACARSTRTEFDAVHPRFREAKKPEVIEQFQRENDYYCEQCKLYFAPTVLGLKTHFKGDMVKHCPLDECFYCQGAVYAYSFNGERQLYHNCEDNK